MSAELRFPLTAKATYEAESARVRGDTNAALKIVQQVLVFNPELTRQLNENERTIYLMALRIAVVSLMSQAKRSWEGPEVASRLEQVRGAISKHYYYPDVQEASTLVKTDAKGDPYEFDVEMKRDEISYLLALAGLTGNSEFITQAVDCLHTLVAISEEPTAKTLVVFTLSSLNYYANPNKETFELLSTSYRNAVIASSEARNWERVATVAARFALTCFSRLKLDEAMVALEDYGLAVGKDPNTKGIFPQELVKTVGGDVQKTIWRFTFKGRDYSHLRLPNPQN